jgi:tetratricopeptide (TPR) repeat protein
LVIAFWVFSYILSVILFFVNARYRLPLISALIPIAAIGLLEMARVVRERRWAQGVLCVVVLALGVGLTRARADAIGTTWVREWVNAGDIYALKGDHERALRFYQKAIELEPEYSKASLAMALTLTKMKRHDEAKEFYLRAIEYDPANSQAYNNLGMWYDRKSDLDEARRYFLKAVELKPSSGQYHNNLGMVYGKMGQDEKAIQEFEEAIRLSPDNARAYTNLGLIFHRQGRKDEAKANWRKALEINPDLEELRRALKALQ